jgi:hypothetical protein
MLRELQDKVIASALNLQAARLYADYHPEDPHSGAQIELDEEILDRAIGEYAAERGRLTHD